MILCEEPLSRHSSIRTGGPGQVVALVESTEELLSVLESVREGTLPSPVRFIGNASNILFPDGGLPGTIVSLKKMDRFDIRPDGLIEAQAGAFLPRLAFHAARRGMGGLGFLSGIPGTVGGGVVMNAGTTTGEMADVLREVCLVSPSGSMFRIDREELLFSYRTSEFQREGLSGKPSKWHDCVIVSAVLETFPSDPSHLLGEWERLRRLRSETQPLEKPNLGSVFRNPPGEFAGRLIEEAGWKGAVRGAIEISRRHANFFVNLGGGLSRDFRSLVEDVRLAILQKNGFRLETEVEIVPEETPAAV